MALAVLMRETLRENVLWGCFDQVLVRAAHSFWAGMTVLKFKQRITHLLITHAGLAHLLLTRRACLEDQTGRRQMN
jgi:hypothetical protein